MRRKHAVKAPIRADKKKAEALRIRSVEHIRDCVVKGESVSVLDLLNELLRVVSIFQEYVGHKDDCAYYVNPYEKYTHCTCKWEAIRDTLPQSWRYHY